MVGGRHDDNDNDDDRLGRVACMLPARILQNADFPPETPLATAPSLYRGFVLPSAECAQRDPPRGY